VGDGVKSVSEGVTDADRLEGVEEGDKTIGVDGNEGDRSERVADEVESVTGGVGDGDI